MADVDEHRELAQWRGAIEARVIALEHNHSELARNVKSIDTSVTTMKTQLRGMRSDLGEMREEIRDAAGQINERQEDVVRKLEDTITTGRATRLQIGLVILAAVLSPACATLVGILIAGHS